MKTHLQIHTFAARLLLWTAVLLAPIAAEADNNWTDANGLVWSYTTSSGKATLTGVEREDGTTLTGTLSVPSSVDGVNVTAIGANAFQNLAVTRLVISDTVTSMGAGAFAGCTALVSADLGNGLVTIGNYTAGFTDHGANTSNPDSYAGRGAFGNCSSLRSVTFGENIVTIGSHAFSECIALEALTLPDSLQTIGVNTFYHNTALASVSFGTGLVTISADAFYNCPELQTVVFRESDTPLLSIGENAFARAVKLTTLTFSGSLKSIGNNAFSQCTSLEALALPDSLTTLGAGAFAGCTALVSADLGNGLVTIGNYTAGFTDHGANTSNPDSYAGRGAFGNCDRLETVIFGGKLKTIGSHAFSECRALRSLDFPDSLQTIGVNCFYNNIRLVDISFGAGLERIGKNSFMRCSSLQSVSFPPTASPLLTIEANAFRACPMLRSLTLSNSILTIESGAFGDCTLLRRITIPSLLSTIGNGVFSSMDNLKEVIFLGLPPENLENAGLPADISLRYPGEYAEDWEPVIAACGFTNATVYEPSETGGLGGGIRYALSTEPGDRSIASVTVNTNTALDDFILENGKVYDCIIRIVNTAANDVSVTLPDGYTYEAFKGATPLTIPAGSRNILTITRTSETTFLVAREELAVIQ